MSNELIVLGVLLWIAAAVIALAGRPVGGRVVLAGGIIAVIAAALVALPGGTPTAHIGLVFTAPVGFQLSPQACWLMVFALAPAFLAVVLGTPLGTSAGRGGLWIAGAAAVLAGAIGVFGLSEGAAFLIAWELMSFGAAVMVLSERSAASQGSTQEGSVLFMLTLLELGAVCLLAAFLWLGTVTGDLGLDQMPTAAAGLAPGVRYGIGVLLIIGFGAKLGLLPFYEWFPGVYGRASGATGVLLSGAALNAAYFGLSRALIDWLPGTGSAGFALGLTLLALAVLTAILAILYAFQEEDWRRLLSLSTAENAGIACAALAASLLFRHAGLAALAGLGWLVGLIHLAGHSLAKSALFLTADGVHECTGSYRLMPRGLLRRSPWPLAVGALFAAMSLAAMPPQAGFVSEWFVFQTVFQGFHLPGLTGPLALSIAGAGLALTAAVAFATFIKAFGVGLLGDGNHAAGDDGIPARHAWAAGLLGVLVLATAVGMPWWLESLQQGVAASLPGASAMALRDGWLLVPLTSHFAFISPTKLVIAGPLLALLPLGLWWLARARRRWAPAWYGGLPPTSGQVAITPLAFSNALRTFYSMVYRPTEDMRREHTGLRYFVRHLSFDHRVAPLFGPTLFAPAVRLTYRLAARLQALQSGSMNLYLAIIGAMLVAIL
ncbi:MAG: proton-conducting transporter membrane subunit, partial [Arenicellales bacterium]